MRNIAVGTLALLAVSSTHADESLARLRRDATTGFAHAGWAYDRYSDMPTLDARTSMVVADLEGPGIIRHIHTTRHHPADLMARGIVLEIWFDDAPEPAVMSPLADFFGDGCNGAAEYFSTPLIEAAPWAYNATIPMPFRKRARVILRNDTDQNAMNYSYIEWEPLAEWDDDLGYFHASYTRHRFQLTPQTSHTFFEARGPGHIIGRQMSVLTSEPLFADLNTVMEGNNEIDIDGVERAIDYLGTEDSFTFSWGFQTEFVGLRAGMPHIARGDAQELSIYRFHDHCPIRFSESITWRINWQEEKGFTSSPQWREAAERGGCQMDYAVVFYWYSDDPGGYTHAPLPPPRMRANQVPVDEADLPAVFEAMPVDGQPSVSFDTAADLERVRVLNAYPGTHPFWIDEPQPVGGHPGNSNPGRRGVLATHPAGADTPCYVLFRCKRPETTGARLRVVVSGDPYEAPGRSDFVLRLGTVREGRVEWLREDVIEAGDPPAEAHWRTLECDLPDNEGPINAIVEVSYGGAVHVMNEEAFLDEISVVGSPAP